MKTKTMLKELHLSQKDFEEISEAVKKAEAKTSGEIETAITAESAHYAFWELLASVCISVLVFAVLLPFAGKINDIYEQLTWTQRIWALPAFYGFVCFATVVASFYLFNIPALDRVVIPRVVRNASVTRRAMRHFTESGIYETAEHSGILIFVSYMERQVRIIADHGIAVKISPDLWKIISDELAAEIKSGNTKAAFISAIEKCGDLLAQNFPAHEENPDELPNGLSVLEDAEWY
jgi:putative membrane protein